MHEHGLGETEGFAREPLEASAQRQVFAFALVRVGFADGMSRGGERALLDPRALRVKGHEPKRLEHLLQLPKDRIGPLPEDIGQHHPRAMINRLPHPPLGGFAPHETPPRSDLRCRHPTDCNCNRGGTTSLHPLSGVGFLCGKRQLVYQWPVELLVLGLWPGLRNEASQREAVLIEERNQDSAPALAKDTDQA